MKNILFVFLCAFIVFSTVACTPRARTRGSITVPQERYVNHLAGGNLSSAEALVPAGMQLGQSYISALGEPCYEVLSTGGPVSQGQALCQRQGSWKLFPRIYMDVPITPVALR